MNQQQLQTARAALWRHSSPIVTLDDASAWLDEIGLCLFLPRHAQLPAPAPSLVEAVLGAASPAPSPGAIAQATELATRLIAEGRAIPLNLLGTFSEQPDFLVTPDVLPWVVAIRGDRQWKTAPSGRSAPIVLRTWEALDQRGPLTAVEIRGQLGRELTEAAVLRALIELWTTLRAIPAYTQGEPTRWSLLKSRYAPQLTTAANTALPTALSALLSIYLRSAVAATAEEAEIFLSPLTARSRIREVLHGMTAARQFHSLSLAPHTLLFVEGSLPEAIPEAATEAAPAKAPDEDRARREAIRKQSPEDRQRPPRREKRPPFGSKPGPRREFAAKRPPFRDRSAPRPFAKPGADRPRDRQFPPRQEELPPRRDDRPAATFRPRQEGASDRPRRDDRGPSQFRPRRDVRPASKSPARPGDRFKGPRREARPWQKDRPAAGFRPRPDARPWQKDRPARPAGEARAEFPAKPGDRRREGPRFAKTGAPSKPQTGFTPRRGKPFSGKPGFSGPRKPFAGKPKFSGPRDRGPQIDRPSQRPRRPDARPDFARPDSSSPDARRPRPFGTGKFRSGPPQKPRSDGPPRFGKGPGKPRFGQSQGKSGFSPAAGKSSRFGAARRFPKPTSKNFPKSSAPRTPKPRKNRSEEESSE